jgi:hypothetical protein
LSFRDRLLVSDEQAGKLGPFVRSDRPELLAVRAVRLDWVIVDEKSDQGAKAINLLRAHILAVGAR